MLGILDTLALGQRMAALRRQRSPRLSVADLAQQAGVSRDTIYRLERGDEVASGSLIRIALCLGAQLELIPLQQPDLQEAPGYFGGLG